MNVLIVDDEPLARRRLRRMLDALEGVHVVGEAADGEEGRLEIERHAPDLVLLDIDMPQCDGLSLAATADMPHVIFVTAHRQHAPEAFELDAVDYLLKPVRRDRLAHAIERVRQRRPGGSELEEVAEVVRDTVAHQRRPPRLSARSGTTLHVFDARDISRLQTRDKYTVFHRNGVEYLLDESLSDLQRRLESWDFVRVHRAELVNLAAVVAVHLGAGESEVELRDGTRVPVSRRMLPELKRRLRT